MIARDWIGETCFIIAGGPSVAGVDLERLKGRRVIVINSSFERAPWADVLCFHDHRWWQAYKARLLAEFKGQIITTFGINHARVTRLKNNKPKNRRSQLPPYPLQLSSDPRSAAMRRTTVSLALNVACLKGVSRIIFLGLDGKFGPNGERNHYAKPYRWEHHANTWDRHQADIVPLVSQVAALGIEVLNANPDSAWGLWPKVSLDEVLGPDGAEENDRNVSASQGWAAAGGSGAGVHCQ